jgi:hypothetical protein
MFFFAGLALVVALAFGWYARRYPMQVIIEMRPSGPVSSEMTTLRSYCGCRWGEIRKPSASRSH